MKYILVEWPESQLYMGYIDLDESDPNKCYWAQDSQDIFVPAILYDSLNIAIYDEDSDD